MKRIPVLAALCAVLLAGCGGSKVSSPAPTNPTTTTPPTSFVCHPKVPAQMGECIRQEEEHEGKAPARPPLGLVAPSGSRCIDIAVYQGLPDWRRARAAGLKCVIVQTNDGRIRNRLFYGQVAGLRTAGIPFGTYAFTEAWSGAAQAAIAAEMAAGQGVTLGAWTDVEVPGSYSQACPFVNYAHSHGFSIVGKYSAPGIVEGPACQGYDWPARWGGGFPFPLPGYSQTQTVIRQSCGTCTYPGVGSEVDLDEDIGLLALAHPKPKPSRQALLARQRTLRRVLVGYGCRRRERRHERIGPRCHRWEAEGRRIDRQLR